MSSTGKGYVGIKGYDSTTTYSLNDVVLTVSNNEVKLYQSLANNNTSSLSDTTKWKEVSLGGEGASRNIGEIVISTIPLVDAGLHLADGALISGSGSYAAFVTYMAGLVSTDPDLFTTEANWQTAVTTYGSCDRYVFDSVNNTIRLPKRTSEHGTLIKSYSSGNDWYRIYQDGWCEQGGTTTSTAHSGITINLIKKYTSTTYTITIGSIELTSNYETSIDNITTSSFKVTSNKGGSNTSGRISWRTAGYIDITNYQYSPIYEYVVIATSTKTAIEVDIDEIATDLNGKADVDLSNMNPTQTVKNTIVGWGMPDFSAGVAFTGTITLPCDALIYSYKSAGGAWDGAGFYINSVFIYNSSAYSSTACCYAAKGSTIQANAGACKYYPLKGVN